MANSYLVSISEFTDRSPFSEEQALELEAKRPGHMMSVAASLSAEIDTRLGKRYQRPIPNPPEIVKLWTADLLTPRAYEALGVRPTDDQQAQIIERAKFVYDCLKEAADSKDGMYELPLSADDQSSGLKQPMTLSVSEQSPYTSRHKQYDAVRFNRRYG